MTSADYLIIIGAIVLLAGELVAVFNDHPKDTITERVHWIAGIGRRLTWYFLISRILIIGFLAWLLLHLSGVGV